MSEPKKVHFAENAKSQDGAPTSDPPDMDQERLKRLADLERKVQHRKTCEQRAQRIVERLLDNPISEEFLIDAAQFLHQDHYSDVTEERSVAKMCGYPLCVKPLPKQPKQKYHISMAHKKVYDITERKNFCSNQCYKASKHFQNQISTTAVWSRQKQPPVCFNVLPLDSSINRGSLGKVVVSDPGANIRFELQQLEDLDKRMGETSIKNHGKDNPVEISMNELVDQVTDMLLIDEAENENGDNETEGHTMKETPQDQGTPQNLSDEGRTDIVSNSTSVSTNARTHGEYPEGRVQNRKVDPRSNDPMVPVPPPPFVSHGEDEASDVDNTINRKAKLLSNLLDQRDKLQEVKNQRQKLDQAKSQEVTRQTPVEKQPSMESSDFTDVTAGIKVSKNSVIDNIRRVSSQQATSDQPKSKKKHKNPKTNLSPLVPIQKAVLEWRTLETSDYLRQASKSEDSDQTEFEKKYALLGRRLDAMDMSAVVGEECLEDAGAETRPLPDFKELRRDTDQLNLKVQEFYKGSMRYPVLTPGDDLEADLKVVERKPTEQVGETEREPVMPHVDAHSQMAIRRKIVFDQLNRVMPDLLRPMRLLVQDVVGDLRQLVNTFSFTSTNIILKSAEWTLMGYILLRLLALKVPVVAEAFSTQAATSIFTSMLAGLGITEAMIQDVLKEMTSPPV